MNEIHLELHKLNFSLCDLRSDEISMFQRIRIPIDDTIPKSSDSLFFGNTKNFLNTATDVDKLSGQRFMAINDKALD